MPVGETTLGQWDFRASGAEEAYHGHFDFSGKRVLEIGAATGSHSFWLERRAREVVPYDLSPEHSWDMMLTPEQNMPDVLENMRAGIQRLNNGWRYCRDRLGSKLELAHGTIYGVPAELGQFDVITFGSVLLHVRDPIGAVQKAAGRADTIIIVDRPPAHSDLNKPYMEFIPKLGMEKPFGGWTWWWITPATYQALLRILGFDHFEISYSSYAYVPTGRNIQLFTLIARRQTS